MNSYIGVALSIIGMCISALALYLNMRKSSSKFKTMNDGELINRGLWDECDGEPMNKYAEEFERRHGINAATKGQQ